MIGSLRSSPINLTDAARLRDAGRRTATARRVTSVAIIAVATLEVRSYGWLPLLIIIAASVAMSAFEVVGTRRPPTQASVLALVLTCGAGIAAAVATSGGHASPLLPLFVVPLLLSAGRLRRKTTLLVLGVVLAMMTAVTFALDPNGTLHPANWPTAAALTTIGIATLTLSLSETEVRLRESARHDVLTGLLSRVGLADAIDRTRVAARGTAWVVAELAGSVPGTTTGAHGVPDADGLRRLAAAVRHAGGRDAIVGRLGGSRLLLALPSSDSADAERIAAGLRDGARRGGRPVTVAVMPIGPGIHHSQDLIARAERVLADARHGIATI